eukprot:scaffold90406_cov15-Tisochrysis_lutea.AAC.2
MSVEGKLHWPRICAVFMSQGKSGAWQGGKKFQAKTRGANWVKCDICYGFHESQGPPRPGYQANNLTFEQPFVDSLATIVAAGVWSGELLSAATGHSKYRWNGMEVASSLNLAFVDSHPLHVQWEVPE